MNCSSNPTSAANMPQQEEAGGAIAISPQPVVESRTDSSAGWMHLRDTSPGAATTMPSTWHVAQRVGDQLLGQPSGLRTVGLGTTELTGCDSDAKSLNKDAAPSDRTLVNIYTTSHKK